MRAKSMKTGGAESFEHAQKPATAIQDHESSPNSIYKVSNSLLHTLPYKIFDN